MPRITFSLSRSLSVLAILTVFWWLLVAGDVGSWILGVPTVLLAWLAYRQLYLAKSSSVSQVGTAVSWFGVLRFVSFFLLESIRGGVDVAWRVWLPRIPIHPEFLVYPIHLPAGTARTLFIYSIGLLPGTLSAELGEDGQLHIHALIVDASTQEGLARVERRIADVFGLDVGKVG